MSAGESHELAGWPAAPPGYSLRSEVQDAGRARRARSAAAHATNDSRRACRFHTPPSVEMSSGTDSVPTDSSEERLMSKYVFAFRNDPGRAATPGEEDAWGAWFGELGGAVADFGNR